MPKSLGTYNNQQIVQKLQLIANLLEIKGEIIYKTLAYRKAADSLSELGRDVGDIWAEEGLKGLQAIPGVGKAIAEKIDELLRTGELDFLNRLAEEVPLSLADLLQVPGLGPKKVALFWNELNITTLEELEAAARVGDLRGSARYGCQIGREDHQRPRSLGPPQRAHTPGRGLAFCPGTARFPASTARGQRRRTGGQSAPYARYRR